MTSVTSPQQTGRGGADIPGPRGGQVVRLLVLGADADAQGLREQAAAAGFELAQRYSARVSHVAYGSGVDPRDARYRRIRDAGLVILPLQACASQLGLGEAAAEVEAEETGDVGETGAGGAAAMTIEVVEIEDGDEVDVRRGDRVGDGRKDGRGDGDERKGALEFPLLRVPGQFDEESGALADSAAELVAGFDRFEGELAQNVADAYAPLETLAGLEPMSVAPAAASEELPPGAAVIGIDPWTGETEDEGDGLDGGDLQGADDGEDGETGGVAADGLVESTTVGNSASASAWAAATTEPGSAAATVTDSAARTGTGTDTEAASATDTEAASVPATGAATATDTATASASATATDTDTEAADATVTETTAQAGPAAGRAAGSADASAGASADAAPPAARVSAGYVLLSLAWGLVPFVTFGLLTPVVFGYAAFRLRSRGLAMVACGYTLAVVLSFALSATRPHGVGAADSSGAGTLLTLALALSWIGGTVHALSLRVRVFAR